MALRKPKRTGASSENVGAKAISHILSGEHPGVVAIDPGGTSGVAWVFAGDGTVYSTQVPGPRTSEELRSILASDMGDIRYLVVERHIPRIGVTMGREARATMELVGELTGVAVSSGVCVVYHTPSQMKTVPWCTEGNGPHARDAVKHLYRFLLDFSTVGGAIGEFEESDE